uniref:Uncharacterized protein n=1 Tax=Tetranychus urticae TaxID=32264 RepID=T1KX67_TETUR
MGMRKKTLMDKMIKAVILLPGLHSTPLYIWFHMPNMDD